MIIAPLSWNLAASGTVSTSANAFRLGYGSDHLFTDDVREQCIFRGATVVTSGQDDKSDFTHSVDGALTATLNAGTYNSPQEFAIELARAHTAAGSATWTCYWQQGSTNRYRYVLGPSSGTASLEINTGTNASDNALRLIAGFRDADRSTAASHTGDFAVSPGTVEECRVDLGAEYVSEASFVANVTGGPSTVVSIGLGTTAAADSETVIFQQHHDNEVMGVFLTAADAVPYRYARLRVSARYDEGPPSAVGYWYLGPVFDTDRDVDDGVDWSTGTRQHSLVGRSPVVKSIDGHAKGSERRADEVVSVAFEAAGVSPGQVPAVVDVLEQIGAEGLAFVALEPTADPHCSSFLARLSGFGVTQKPTSSRLGRFTVTTQWRKVQVL